MTAVFESTSKSPRVERVYLVLEARVPPDLTDLPVLRTRFLDLWVRPGKTRDGTDLDTLPEVHALLAPATKALWDALLTPTTVATAFVAAESALRGLAATGHTLIACGRLGDVG